MKRIALSLGCNPAKVIQRSTLATLLALAISTVQAGPLFNLGAAGPKNFTILQVGSGTVMTAASLSNLSGGVKGNVGVTSGGDFWGYAAQINGDLYMGNNTSAQFTGSYTGNRPVAGITHLGSGATLGPGGYSFTTMSDNPQALLNQARVDALNASAAASGLSATSALTKITDGMTLFGSGVYNLSQLSLGNNEILTLSGNIGDSIVFNISDTFKLSGAKILLTGGLLEENVLFNYTGTSTVAFSGASNKAELHGIILALNAKVTLSPGLIVGEIISGNDITISSGAMVQSANTPLTVPDSGRSLLLLLIGLVSLFALRRFLPQAQLLR